MEGNAPEAPISELIQQAVALREARDRSWRSDFEKLPTFYQNSLVVADEVRTARELPFLERLQFAVSRKDAGNVHFREGQLFDAVHCYEEALAVFRYLENKDPDWRRKGVEDPDIVRHEMKATTETETEKLCDFYCSCYVNLAIALFKMDEFAKCIQACDAAIGESPQSAKAFFKRAQARMAPASAGAVEYDLAMQDLVSALKLAPNDAAVLKAFNKAKNEQAMQVAKDKKTFAGMFERGNIYEDDHRTASNTDHKPISTAPKQPGHTTNQLSWIVGIVAGLIFFVWRLWQTGILGAVSKWITEERSSHAL